MSKNFDVNSQSRTCADMKKLIDELLKSNREIIRELKKISPHALLLEGWFPTSYVKELLGISNSTLFRYMRDGTLPYSKIGSRTMFNQKDVLALLDRNYRRGQ